MDARESCPTDVKPALGIGPPIRHIARQLRRRKIAERADQCTGQSPKVNDTYERPSDAEQRVDDGKLVQGNSLLLFLMVLGRLNRDCC